MAMTTSAFMIVTWNFLHASTTALVRADALKDVKVGLPKVCDFLTFYLGCNSAYCKCHKGDESFEYLECKELVYFLYTDKYTR